MRNHGMIIKERRKELKLRAQDIADLMGVSRPLISQWEGGVPVPQERIADLARALDLPEEAFAVVTRYVKTDDDIKAWRRRVFADHDQDKHVRIMLMYLPELLDEKDIGIKTYNGSMERVAEAVAILTSDQAAKAWSKVLWSPYVERHGDSAFCLYLCFPVKPLERSPDRTY
jgi:transcriptional regulator with XRE-family HTH domain